MTDDPEPAPATGQPAAPGRDEAPEQRADRNFAELLQELRVLLVGVQILFGFLLTLAFSASFAGLDTVQHTAYVVTLLGAALSSALLVGPVAVHRLLFQGGRKPELVRAGHAMAVTALAALGVTLSAGLYLVLDVVVGQVAAFATTAVYAVTVVILWWAVPARIRRRTTATEP